MAVRDRPGTPDEPEEPEEPEEPGRADRPRWGGDGEHWDPVLADGSRLSQWELPEVTGSAWEDPAVRDDDKRPDPERVRLDGERRAHILDGDVTGGGHRFGTGREGKSEFPQRWDDETTVRQVLDVADRPSSVEWQKNGRWKVRGERDDVDIVAVVNPDGGVWAAYPLPGGRGVVENPKEGSGG